MTKQELSFKLITDLFIAFEENASDVSEFITKPIYDSFSREIKNFINNESSSNISLENINVFKDYVESYVTFKCSIVVDGNVIKMLYKKAPVRFNQTFNV